MIFRLSQKLSDRIKTEIQPAVAIGVNLFADWSATLFVAERTRYILLTNTASLYSTFMPAKGINNSVQFQGHALRSIREFMERDGLATVYGEFIAPACGTFCFAKALNPSVIGSINDLVYCAKASLNNQSPSPFDIVLKLNETPFSLLKYKKPREAFRAFLNHG